MFTLKNLSQMFSFVSEAGSKMTHLQYKWSSSCLSILHAIYTVAVYLNFNSSSEISHLHYINSHKENQFAPSCTTKWLHN